MEDNATKALHGSCVMWSSCLLLALELLGPAIAWTGEARSILAFEGSTFSKKYPATRKTSWALRSGGMNFSYPYADSESDSGSSVELSSDASRITHYGISWHGESKQLPAKLTLKREAFLRDLLRFIDSNAAADAVVAYVRKNAMLRYSAGMSAAPLHNIGGIGVKAVVVGSSLIITLDVTSS